MCRTYGPSWAPGLSVVIVLNRSEPMAPAPEQVRLSHHHSVACKTSVVSGGIRALFSTILSHGSDFKLAVLCWRREECIRGKHFCLQQVRNSASIILSLGDNGWWAKFLPLSRLLETPPLGPTADQEKTQPTEEVLDRWRVLNHY